MVTKVLRLALHDGNGNQTVTEGISKWDLATILDVHNLSVIPSLCWGDMAGYLYIKASKITVDAQLLDDLQKRKKKLNWPLFVSGATMAKYLANHTDIHAKFIDEQDQKFAELLATPIGQEIASAWANRPGHWKENVKKLQALTEAFWKHGETGVSAGLTKIKNNSGLLIAQGIHLKKLVNLIVLGRDNKKWREKFQVDGQQPKWTSVLDLDTPNALLNTPTWQHMPDE